MSGMNENEAWDRLHWYLIHTHPKQETRVEAHLKRFSPDTYLPRRLTERMNSFTDEKCYVVKPLFPRYIFARFSVNNEYHKVSYTRGVQAVVSFNHEPTIVDDEVVELIRSRESKDGLVRVQEAFLAGDLVRINDGPMKNLLGVFERTMSDSDRVVLLLRAVEYQAHVVLHRTDIRKVDPEPSSSP